jgi:hypothetical protein
VVSRPEADEPEPRTSFFLNVFSRKWIAGIAGNLIAGGVAASRFAQSAGFAGA